MDQPISFCVQLNSVNETIPSAEERTVLVAIGIFNAVFAFPTVFLNALVIVAIVSTPSLVTPSYLLVMNLAFTDLLVGLLGQPLHTAMVLYYRDYDLLAYCYIRSVSAVVSVIAANASLLTVTAIAVDRYLAIRLKMQYRSVVTVTKVKFVLMLIWGWSMVSIIFLFSLSAKTNSTMASLLIVVYVMVIVVSYGMAFKTLKKHKSQIETKNCQETRFSSVDVAKYKKLLKTMLIILGFIMVCYSILAVATKMLSNPQNRRSLLWGLLSITYLNSTLNPVIYIATMKDLREACILIVRKSVRSQISNSSVKT